MIRHQPGIGQWVVSNSILHPLIQLLNCFEFTESTSCFGFSSPLRSAEEVVWYLVTSWGVSVISIQ